MFFLLLYYFLEFLWTIFSTSLVWGTKKRSAPGRECCIWDQTEKNGPGATLPDSVVSLLGTQCTFLNSNGILPVLKGTPRLQHKHGQLAEGCCSSLWLPEHIHCIGSTQTQNPSLRHLVFSTYPFFLSVKSRYYNANCGSTLRSVVGREGFGGEKRSKLVTVLNLCVLREEVSTKRP